MKEEKKSSKEILSELFDKFNATPPSSPSFHSAEDVGAKQETVIKKECKKKRKKPEKSPKLKKKRKKEKKSKSRKHRDKKSKKKRKKRHRSKSSSESSNESTDSESEGTSLKRAKKTKTEPHSSSCDSKKKCEIRPESDNSLTDISKIIKKEVTDEGNFEIKPLKTPSTGALSENNVSAMLLNIKTEAFSESEDVVGINQVNNSADDHKTENIEQKGNKIGVEPDENVAVVLPDVVPTGCKVAHGDTITSHKCNEGTKNTGETEILTQVADIFVEELLESTYAAKTSNPEKPKCNIKITDLKKSNILELAEKRAQWKAEKYEEGEITSDSSEDSEPEQSIHKIENDILMSKSKENKGDKERSKDSHNKSCDHKKGSKSGSESRGDRVSNSKEQSRLKKTRSRSKDKKHRSRSSCKKKSSSLDRRKDKENKDKDKEKRSHRDRKEKKSSDQNESSQRKRRDSDRKSSKERKDDKAEKKEKIEKKELDKKELKEKKDSKEKKDPKEKRKSSKERGERRSKSRERRRNKSKSPLQLPSMILQGNPKKKRRSRSRNRGLEIDKKKLLEIARKNALSMLKQQGTTVPTVSSDPAKVATITAGGKTVDELTDFCKQLSQKEGKEDNIELSPITDSSEDEGEKAFHHPFLIKDRPTNIVMNIRNCAALPVKTHQEKTAEAASQLRLQFPVSSGQHHRKTENEWVPVEPKKDEPAAVAKPKIGVKPPPEPGLPKAIEPPPLPPPELISVFPSAEESVNINIGDIVGQKLAAMKRLHDNQGDIRAQNLLRDAEEKLARWNESNQLQQPGLFTGSTGARLLTPAELASGQQAWAKKDQLMCATPVTGGIGKSLLQKMGWRPGEGLGKNHEGTLEPLSLPLKMDKRGLVCAEEVKKPPRFMNNMRNIKKQHTIKSLEGKHPVSLLLEYCTKRHINPPNFTVCYESGPSHKRMFLFKVDVNGTEYQPRAPSNNKKHAKSEAAIVCLKALGLMPSTTLPSNPH